MEQSVPQKRSLETEDGTDSNKLQKTEQQNLEQKLSKSQRRRQKQKLNKQLSLQVTCELPSSCYENPQIFENQSQFNSHYEEFHQNICAECKRNFPSSKLLDCHLMENHNPIAKIKLERNEPIFQCFVSDCDKVFSNHKKRRLHLIDKHKFSKDFIFSVVDKGINKNTTKLIKKDNKGFNVWKSARED